MQTLLIFEKLVLTSSCKMNILFIAFCVCLYSLPNFCVQSEQSNEDICEKEEKQIEICAQEFLVFRNKSLPESQSELDQYCRQYNTKQVCLREHSKKCLSLSANQAISDLIRTMAKQNRDICNNKNQRRLIIRANQCFNKYNNDDTCLNQFVQRIHGIHQFSQESKIPVICCNYHSFLGCIQNQLKQCKYEIKNTMNRLVVNYSGETLNYVCKEYGDIRKCSNTTKVTLVSSPINEEIPQSFFSLLVKIYLS